MRSSVIYTKTVTQQTKYIIHIHTKFYAKCCNLKKKYFSYRSIDIIPKIFCQMEVLHLLVFGVGLQRT
jgi:hypothetical protein